MDVSYEFFLMFWEELLYLHYLGMSAISYPIVKLVYQTAWYIDDPSYEQSLYNSINIKFD